MERMDGFKEKITVGLHKDDVAVKLMLQDI